MAFIWKGEEVQGGIAEIYSRIVVDVSTKEEALEFKAGYAEMVGEEVAASNLGYMTGYMDRELGARIRDWFEVKHPIFDFEKNPDPTPTELMQAGAEYFARYKEEKG